MKETALVDVLDVVNDVAVSSTTGRCDDVLVEGEGDEDDDGQEVDGGADGTHAFRKKRA